MKIFLNINNHITYMYMYRQIIHAQHACVKTKIGITVVVADVHTLANMDIPRSWLPTVTICG